VVKSDVQVELVRLQDQLREGARPGNQLREGARPGSTREGARSTREGARQVLRATIGELKKA